MTAMVIESSYHPDFHVHQLSDFLWLTFDRLYDEKGALWCEASVEARNDNTSLVVVPPTRTNLLTSRGGWRSIADSISEYSESIEWFEVVKDAVNRSIIAFRKGQDPVALAPSTGDLPDHEPFLIEPFVAGARTSVIYASGGVGKSLIGLGAAISVASGHSILGHAPTKQGNVLYIDYEDSAEAHQRRLDKIMRGHGVPALRHSIYHKTLNAKVSNAQTEVRKMVVEHKAALVIVDSIGMARGGDLNSGEDTIRLFRTLNSLGCPVLCIDHVSSDDMKRNAEKGDVIVKPIGSSYTYNAVRLAWFLSRLPSSTSGKTFMQATNTKSSHTGRREPRMVSIEWGDEEIRINVNDTSWQELELGAWELIRIALSEKGTWMGIPELERATRISSGTIAKTLSRNEHELDLQQGGGKRGVPKIVRLKRETEIRQSLDKDWT